MERMRDLLRGSLGRSLQSAPEFDRLEAAWTVACGPALAARGRLLGFADGVVQVEVADRMWLEQFGAMQAMLERELARIAAVPVGGIHFVLRRTTR